MKFLENAVDSPNKAPPLHSDIFAEGVIPFQYIPNMLGRINPRKTVTIQLNLCLVNLLSRKMDAFCFRLHRIIVSTKPQVVAHSKLLTDVHHGLETHSAGTEENNIISIHHDSIVGGSNATSKLGSPQEMDQLVHIQSEENRRGHSTLADTIPHTKLEGHLPIPLYITRLLTVDEQENSQEHKAHFPLD